MINIVQLIIAFVSSEFQSIRDQFEFESFYIRCDIDHTPSDTKDMTLSKGSLVRVVNSSLYPDAWLAWSVDESTGIDMELRRIPSPKKCVCMIISQELTKCMIGGGIG